MKDYQVTEKQLNNLAAYFNGVIDNIKYNDPEKATELARLGVEMINYHIMKRDDSKGGSE